MWRTASAMITLETGPATGDRAAAILPFLEREPVLHGIAIAVLRQGERAELTVAREGREPAAVGVCNSRKYLLSRAVDLEGPARMGADAAARLGPLPGWMGPAAEARAFGAAWEAAGGGPRATLELAMRIYTLDRAPRLPHVPGAFRPATADDLPVLVPWRRAFGLESGADSPDDGQAGAVIERHLADGTLFVWVDGGRVVSMANANIVAGAARLGAVYTPPPLRRRGYASACVGAASAFLLGAGHGYCYLYADLANPISNSIYQRLGYGPVADVEDWRPGPA